MDDLKIIPVSFLGLADHHEMNGYPYPYGPLDLFRLSKFKRYLIYPWGLKTNLWVFLIHVSIFEDLGKTPLTLNIEYEDGFQLATVNLQSIPRNKEDNVILPTDKIEPGVFPMGPMDDDWHFIFLNVDVAIPKPGKCLITATYKGDKSQIGQLVFLYDAKEPLQAEDIKAMEADPQSAKYVSVVLNCKECNFEYKIYTALDRNKKLESKGNIWQYDLPKDVKCTCGKMFYNLKWIKESVHALLGQTILTGKGVSNYSRRYSHQHIMEIVEKLFTLLKEEKDEKLFQEFIEKNLVLLSQFHATKIFIQPKILDKFIADFAILDSKKQLIFIELEKPSMKLFKKDGHPTANLTHAYGQVVDWLQEYSKHQSAILESLDLDADNVHAVKGIVIAGNSKNEDEKFLQRHMMVPPYPNVDFMTLDQLGRSLSLLSRELV